MKIGMMGVGRGVHARKNYQERYALGDERLDVSIHMIVGIIRSEPYACKVKGMDIFDQDW